MKPLSDFTTPRTLIAPISRHFFPVEQPEPFCCTTGLKKGSRLPLIAHFFSSAFGLGASSAAFTGAGAAATFTAAGAGFDATMVLVWALASDFAGWATGFEAGAAAGAFATATVGAAAGLVVATDFI